MVGSVVRIIVLLDRGDYAHVVSNSEGFIGCTNNAHNDVRFEPLACLPIVRGGFAFDRIPDYDSAICCNNWSEA